MIRALLFAFLGWALFSLPPAAIAQDSADTMDFRVEAFVSNPTPFVGESVDYVFRFYASQLPAGLIDDLPDFTGFWLVEALDIGESRVETINGRQYFVGEHHAIISPMREGMLTIEPAALIIPETVFREEVSFSTESITLNVRPLPPGAPAEFNGAVGQFHADITVDHITLTLGQPIRLTMQITGTGNLHSLRAPGVSFPAGWRVYTNPSRYTSNSGSGLRIGAKTFEWLVMPERTGSQPFPAVIFAFFNPQTGEYHSVVEPPFTVNILPGAGGIQQLPSLEIPEGETDVAFPIKPAPARMSTSSPRPGTLFWVLWIIPPLATLACGSWVYAQRYQAHRQQVTRRNWAITRASKRLRAARRGPPPKSGEQITSAICDYIADKLGQPVTTVRTTILPGLEIAPELITALADCLREAEAIRYIPAYLETDIDALVARTLAVLTELEEIWEMP